MNCAFCSSSVELEEHYFYSGLAQLSRPPNKRPDKEWTYIAALYHFKKGEEILNFCSCNCSTKYYENYKATN